MPKVKRGRVRAVSGTKSQRPPRKLPQQTSKSQAPDGGPGRETPKADLHSGPAGRGLASKLVEQFRTGCRNHVASHPECKKDAPCMEKYMRNQFRMFGLKSPARRIIERETMDANKMVVQDRATLVDVVTLLWEQEEREFQYFSCSLLVKHRKTLMGSSEEEFHEAIETVKKCICSKSWWDTVDMLASHGKGR